MFPCLLCSYVVLFLFAFQPVVTLDGAISFTFSKEGRHTVTVQASVGNTVHQDQMTVAVYGKLNTHRQPLNIIMNGKLWSQFCVFKFKGF